MLFKVMNEQNFFANFSNAVLSLSIAISKIFVPFRKRSREDLRWIAYSIHKNLFYRSRDFEKI